MKKTTARILWVTALLCCLALVYAGLDYIVSDDTTSMSRITIRDYYETEPVDVLFIGPSHSIYAIDAPELTERTGKSVFSLTMSSMDFIQSYYLLKEAFRVKDVSEVFLEISPSRLVKQESHPTATYLITDYLRSPVIRAEMIFATVQPESYLDCLFRLRRNIGDIPTPARAKEVISNKKRDEFTGDALYRYRGRGYWTKDPVAGRCDVLAVNVESSILDRFRAEDVQNSQLRYLEKIIRLCGENGADLTFFVCPFSDPYLRNFADYENVLESARALGLRYGVRFLDLNHVREEYLKLDASDFRDVDHVGRSGCEKVTSFLERYLADPSGDYFCNELRSGMSAAGNVAAAGYRRTVILRNGTAEDGHAEREAAGVRVRIFAFPDASVPVEVRVTETVPDGENGTLVSGRVLEPERSDGQGAEYVLPAGEKESPYQVELLEPGTGTVLCTAQTFFDMK